MSVVHVQPVKLQYDVHFFFDRFSHSFYTQNLKQKICHLNTEPHYSANASERTYSEYFADIVGKCSNRVHISFAKHFHQTGTVRFQKPVSNGFEFSALGDNDSLFRVGGWQVHVYFGNSFDTLSRKSLKTMSNFQHFRTSYKI